MFVGHFAVGFAAKRFAPRTPLPLLLLASQAPDILWPVFVLTGFEHAEIEPGITAVTPINFYDYPISHSLLMDVIWAVLFAGLYYKFRPYLKGAIAIGIAVFSHWILDWISHAPDMPIIPGWRYKVGLGVWNSQLATILIEGSMFALGLALYATSTHKRDAKGSYGLWCGAALLAGIWILNMIGPPPPSITIVAIFGLAALPLIYAWAWWVGKHRIYALA